MSWRRVPKLYWYFVPVCTVVPAAMYWVVDHKPQDELERDLAGKYKHILKSRTAHTRKKATGKKGQFQTVIMEHTRDGTLDELLKRGARSRAKIEFTGPRVNTGNVEGKKESNS